MLDEPRVVVQRGATVHVAAAELFEEVDDDRGRLRWKLLVRLRRARELPLGPERVDAENRGLGPE